ncbi:uncharacterized protein LOC100375268 [Saccoglossus kowalevskii]|uniref:Peroxisomal membrane protein PEX14 n=1 Tax=Saccoglossus kowalevskii TaxID=10224 RepID=A0ABM0GNG6_SACKO|nr:PREDICTED: peroxisomal membrane protein PEX14-like [Saccoglossus kowalevskii]
MASSKVESELGESSPGNTDSSIVSTAPRENMINTAIKFLQNPKVRQSQFSTRRAFLQKKGLTSAEIEIAIQRSGTAADEHAPPQPPVQSGAVIPMSSATASLPSPSPKSTWAKTRDFLAVAVIVGGATYGIMKLIKAYFAPLLQSRKEEIERLERMERSIQELNTNVTQALSELRGTLVNLQEALTQNNDKLQDASAGKIIGRSIDQQSINEIKSEVLSLKGLILNRHQFPSAPTPSPIPAWQRVDTASAKTSETQDDVSADETKVSGLLNTGSGQAESVLTVESQSSEIKSQDGINVTENVLDTSADIALDIDNDGMKGVEADKNQPEIDTQCENVSGSALQTSTQVSPEVNKLMPNGDTDQHQPGVEINSQSSPCAEVKNQTNHVIQVDGKMKTMDYINNVDSTIPNEPNSMDTIEPSQVKGQLNAPAEEQDA